MGGFVLWLEALADLIGTFIVSSELISMVATVCGLQVVSVAGVIGLNPSSELPIVVLWGLEGNVSASDSESSLKNDAPPLLGLLKAVDVVPLVVVLPLLALSSGTAIPKVKEPAILALASIAGVSVVLVLLSILHWLRM